MQTRDLTFRVETDTEYADEIVVTIYLASERLHQDSYYVHPGEDLPDSAEFTGMVVNQFAAKLGKLLQVVS